MTTLQKKVVETAKEKLRNEPWFRGVCLDSLPNDHGIQRDGVDEVAGQLVCDTLLWDGPLGD